MDTTTPMRGPFITWGCRSPTSTSRSTSGRILGVEPRWRTCSTGRISPATSGTPASRSTPPSSTFPVGSCWSSSATGGGRTQNPEATANPGNVHLCLRSTMQTRRGSVRSRQARARSSRGPDRGRRRPEPGRESVVPPDPRPHLARAPPTAAPAGPDAVRRYERLHPAELRAVLERAPIAFVPVGTLEFHGEHLPFGVDSFEAHALCLRTAERCGGVVLPPSTSPAAASTCPSR